MWSLINLTYPLHAVWHIRLAQDIARPLCLGVSLLLCPMSTQQPSVPSVLGSSCCCAPCQPSSLRFPLSWALLAAVPHVNPAAFSSSSIVRRHVVFGLPLFLFLLASMFLFLLASRCSSCKHDQAMSPSLFQVEADVLLFCCLVESGVGDGLGPVHFQYLP